ncbi:hypothetical protein ACS0TY_036921 [Phlomoides rotata]
MDSNYGIARELSDLQKLRSQYKPELPPYLQASLSRIFPTALSPLCVPDGASPTLRNY